MIALSNKVNNDFSENKETYHQNGHSSKSDIDIGFAYMVHGFMYNLTINMQGWTYGHG